MRNRILLGRCCDCDSPPPWPPPDPCPDSEIPFGINDSGTLSIDQTFTWGVSDPSTFITANRPFRVYYPGLPTIRFRVELDVIDIGSSVSAMNMLQGRFFLNHSPFDATGVLAQCDSQYPFQPFSAEAIRTNLNGQPFDSSSLLIPDILEAEIAVLNVTEDSPTSGTVTIERKVWTFTTTQGLPHLIQERNEPPTITEHQFSYTCATNFSFAVDLIGSVERALGFGDPPNIEPYLRGDLHWEVEVTY